MIWQVLGNVLKHPECRERQNLKPRLVEFEEDLLEFYNKHHGLITDLSKTIEADAEQLVVGGLNDDGVFSLADSFVVFFHFQCQETKYRNNV